MIQEDTLDRRSFTNQFARDLASLGRPEDGARIVALTGPWGSGKTWILEQVRGQLAGVVRSFNPWLFSDELGLYRGFASLLIERISDKRARKNLAAALDFIGPSLKGFGFDAAGTAAQAAKAIQGYRSPEEIRTRLIAATQSPASLSYVVIDDVDRLTPDELLLLFKLIRLVGDVPGVVYVLAYDEDTLLHLLERTDIAFGRPDRARRYLEKIVERKHSVPPLDDAQKTQLISDAIVAFGRSVHSDFGSQEEQQLLWRLERHAWSKLNTPRIIDRYITAV